MRDKLIALRYPADLDGQTEAAPCVSGAKYLAWPRRWGRQPRRLWVWRVRPANRQSGPRPPHLPRDKA